MQVESPVESISSLNVQMKRQYSFEALVNQLKVFIYTYLGRERFSILWFTPTNVCKSQGWASLKPGTQCRFPVGVGDPGIWIITCCLTEYASAGHWNPEWRWDPDPGIQIWMSSVPGSIFTAHQAIYLKGKEAERPGETTHLLIHSPNACSNSKQSGLSKSYSQELGTQSRPLTKLQGPNYLKHHQLAPRLIISKKLESTAEVGL